MTAAALRDRLTRISPPRARAQTAAIAALTGRAIEDLRLSVHITLMPSGCGWIGFDAEGAVIAMTPRLVDGAVSRLAPGDGVMAAAMLARLEPLIAMVEQAAARALDPISCDGVPDADAMTVLVEARDVAGAVVHCAVFAFPPDFAFAARVARPALPGALRSRWTAAFTGPRVSAKRLAGLGKGDLALLGKGPLAARIVLPGVAGHYPARFDAQARSFILTGSRTKGDRPMGLHDNPEQAPGGDIGDVPATLQVPLSAELDGGMIAVADIAGLGEGSVLALPDGPGALRVRLRAGETVIGEGEVVALGEGFGIVVTGLFGA